LQQQIFIYEKIILSAFMLIGLAFSTQAQDISKSTRFTFRDSGGLELKLLTKSFGKQQ
jgi:hypothetical protein